MNEVYIYSDTAKAAAELVAYAKEAGKAAYVIAINQVGDFYNTGADRVVVLTGASDREENYAQAIADVVKEGAALLASSTVRGREIAAMVAGILDAPMFSDASKIEFSNEGAKATRSVYGGSVVSSESAKGFIVATMMAGLAEAALAPATEVVEVAVQADCRVVRTGIEPLEKGGIDLSAADIVVGVGLGLDSIDDLAVAQGLADTLGAAVGCTRDVAETRKWLPKDQYIGITGVIVKPKLYIGAGLSGAMQHVFGVRDSKVIVAINRDKDAPIFRSADYGIVGDLKEVLPQLTAAVAVL